jgi:hypothetical protein
MSFCSMFCLMCLFHSPPIKPARLLIVPRKDDRMLQNASIILDWPLSPDISHHSYLLLLEYHKRTLHNLFTMLNDGESDQSSESRSKEPRIEESFSSRPALSSMNAAQPSFFGDFIQRCGGPSNGPVMRTDSGCADGCADGCVDGCFGIRLGQGGMNTNTAEKDGKEEDPAAVIAQAMNNLSVQEREQAYEDMHGVSARVQETPQLIAKTLTKMEQCLEKIHHKPAYDMAVTIRADYVGDAKLRLMFLRADRFDPELAAKRLIRFMDWRLKLFGREKLCQWHIGVDDLEYDARCMLESGVLQFLPSRDSRGRVVAVISSDDHIRLERSTQSTLQMIFYTLMCATEDETNQKMGMAIIVHCLGQEERVVDSEKRNCVFECTKVALCVPLRLEVGHFCMNKTGSQFYTSLTVKAFGVFHRARLRVHFGSPLECVYALLSFGLPSTLLPFTPECELKTGNHKKWIQRRIVKERELRHVGVFWGIDLPSRNDVLRGQGAPVQRHPGNQRLQELCRFYLDEYNKADRQSKAIVARRVVQEILHPSDPLGGIGHGGEGGRFLTLRDSTSKNEWWVEETDEDVLIEKVCAAFRTLRKKFCVNIPVF